MMLMRMPATIRFACAPNPCHPAAPAPWRVEKTTRFLKGVWASSGHRGRDDARGRRCHWAPGLTRTSGHGAGVPCRVRRARRLRRRALGRHLRAGDGQLGRMLGVDADSGLRPTAVDRRPERTDRKLTFELGAGKRLLPLLCRLHSTLTNRQHPTHQRHSGLQFRRRKAVIQSAALLSQALTRLCLGERHPHTNPVRLPIVTTPSP